ncbi:MULTISPECIES: hypothetical protein [unclassified Granulicatella]|uniref:hypothetical protein n=1 Tax=unclassified Granulicatella TaxID=2630493 RepID=UPI0011042672|nr:MULTISPECIES: hypothetical protein [unclassified Granulicatella]MBF0780260.1 hypothetical protein [Granulicatella sp. 19428wC4_WM01]TFU95641.1 hypothetical protein E4T68_04025 [Granulicatella sp. WM01]
MKRKIIGILFVLIALIILYITKNNMFNKHTVLVNQEYTEYFLQKNSISTLRVKGTFDNPTVINSTNKNFAYSLQIMFDESESKRYKIETVVDDEIIYSFEEKHNKRTHYFQLFSFIFDKKNRVIITDVDSGQTKTLDFDIKYDKAAYLTYTFDTFSDSTLLKTAWVNNEHVIYDYKGRIRNVLRRSKQFDVDNAGSLYVFSKETIGDIVYPSIVKMDYNGQMIKEMQVETGLFSNIIYLGNDEIAVLSLVDYRDVSQGFKVLKINFDNNQFIESDRIHFQGDMNQLSNIHLTLQNNNLIVSNMNDHTLYSFDNQLHAIPSTEAKPGIKANVIINGTQQMEDRPKLPEQIILKSVEKVSQSSQNIDFKSAIHAKYDYDIPAFLKEKYINTYKNDSENIRYYAQQFPYQKSVFYDDALDYKLLRFKQIGNRLYFKGIVSAHDELTLYLVDHLGNIQNFELGYFIPKRDNKSHIMDAYIQFDDLNKNYMYIKYNQKIYDLEYFTKPRDL